MSSGYSGFFVFCVEFYSDEFFSEIGLHIRF